MFLRFKNRMGFIDMEKRGIGLLIGISIKKGGIGLLIGKEFDFSSDNE